MTRTIVNPLRVQLPVMYCPGLPGADWCGSQLANFTHVVLDQAGEPAVNPDGEAHLVCLWCVKRAPDPGRLAPVNEAEAGIIAGTAPPLTTDVAVALLLRRGATILDHDHTGGRS